MINWFIIGLDACFDGISVDGYSQHNVNMLHLWHAVNYNTHKYTSYGLILWCISLIDAYGSLFLPRSKKKQKKNM